MFHVQRRARSRDEPLNVHHDPGGYSLAGEVEERLRDFGIEVAFATVIADG